MFFLRLFVCLLGLLTLPITWSDCAAKASGKDPRYGGVYRAPLLNNPPTLDPAYVSDMYGVAVVQQLFDGLVQFSPDLYVIPALAENWQVENGGTTYRFSLRSNARFHNGQPVTSQDVVYSLSRLFRVDPPPTILPTLLKIRGAGDYRDGKADRVSGFQIVDDKTLTIHLEQPYAPFLVALGMYQAKIVPGAEVKRDEKLFGQKPIGSGPFEFESWTADKVIRLKAFPDYYGGRAYLDAVNFEIYPGVDVARVFADFTEGKLEEVEVYGEFFNKLRGRKDLKWVHRPSLSLQFYGFNFRNPRLKEPLRRALSLAIDRRKLQSVVYEDLDEPAVKILPPGLLGSRPAGQENPYDIEKAKEIAKELPPLTDPIEIVSNSQSPYAKAELEFVRESWAKLGIELKVKFIPDWNEFESYLESGAFQVYRYVWFADIPDPDDFFRPLFLSSSPFNYMGFQNEQVDQMIDEAVSITDQVQRASVYHQIEDLILASYPLIPISHYNVNFVYQPRVQGVSVSALGAHNMSYHHIWLRNETSP